MGAFFRKPVVRTAIVAVLALLWNGMLYFLVREQMDPVAAQTLTDEYRTFIDVRPIWELIAANVTYGAGLVGAVLLLVSARAAVWAFGLSTLAASLTVIPTFVLGPFIIGMFMLCATVFAALFTGFARRR